MGKHFSKSQVIATLRLLRLLVKHGGALDPLFRAGLGNTPAKLTHNL